ncbi:MAG: hypothetical protein HKN41_07080, partial [Ilumatobacter sp.]|nr:hypothetical protein [Ilumatobacter sp.]
MTTVDVDDRDGRLASIVAGEGAFERGTGFEPNLLPALAERGSASLIGQVIAAADMFGREDRHPDAWPYLRERTMLVVLRRFGRDDLLGLTSGETDPTEVDVWRASEGQSFDLDAVRTRLATGDDWRYPQLSARLLAADGDVGAIRSFCERHEGRDLDSIAVRMLAESAAAHGAPLPTPWLDAAIGDAGDGLPLGRIAHLLPLVADGDRRRALVVETVGRLTGRPPWFASLVAAAIGDEAPHHVVDELLGADLFPPVWRALVRASFAATPATSPDDV